MIGPSEVVPGSTVYLPFITTLAEKIAKRLEGRDVDWAVPPKIA